MYMNQGRLEVVKQEMARVNIGILEISEIKWTGMGEFNSDDHFTYYCGQESLRRNGVAITVNKSLKCSTWMQSQKQQNDLCLFPRQTIQYHSNPSLKKESEVAQSSPTLSDLMDCSPTGSSIHRILQARVLEWGANSASSALLVGAETWISVIFNGLPWK